MFLWPPASLLTQALAGLSFSQPDTSEEGDQFLDILLSLGGKDVTERGTCFTRGTGSIEGFLQVQCTSQEVKTLASQETCCHMAAGREASPSKSPTCYMLQLKDCSGLRPSLCTCASHKLLLLGLSGSAQGSITPLRGLGDLVTPRGHREGFCLMLGETLGCSELPSHLRHTLLLLRVFWSWLPLTLPPLWDCDCGQGD